MSESTEIERASFVLLLRKWKPLEVDTINDAIMRAFGSSRDPDTQFALPVIESAQYMVNVRGSSMLMIYTNPSQYFDDPNTIDSFIESDNRLGSIVRDHVAWLSIDVIGSDASEDEQYDTIGALLAALAPADGTSVALFVPQKRVMIRFDERRRVQLEGPKTLSLLGLVRSEDSST
jgi:hypothetical protein